jgi:hypothetical protein
MHKRGSDNTGRPERKEIAEKIDILLRTKHSRNSRMAGRPGRPVTRNFRYATYRSDGEFTPEQRLWAGVLEQAVHDLKRKKPIYIQKGMGWQIKAQVSAWFKSESEEVGTFNWVCDHLNIDQKTVCQKLGVKI